MFKGKNNKTVGGQLKPSEWREKMSIEELIEKLKRITHENTDLLCDFCKYESECPRCVKSYAGEPWFPPCVDLDIDKYIDFDSVEEFEEESEDASCN